MGEPCEVCGDWIRKELPHQCDETFLLQREVRGLRRALAAAEERAAKAMQIQREALDETYRVVRERDALRAQVERLRAVAEAAAAYRDALSRLLPDDASRAWDALRAALAELEGKGEG